MPPDGPEDEFARLYDAFGGPLYRYALMILADHAGAEDVIQQVFVSLITRGLPGIEDKERYLRSAVRNACYSVLRRRASGVERASADDRLIEALPDISEPLCEEILIDLDAGLRRLPPDQREVLHLHAFEGRTFREIAETMGESLNTIASRYRYALAKLKHLLSR